MKGELPPKRPHEPANKTTVATSRHSRHHTSASGSTAVARRAESGCQVPLDGAEAILTETCGLGQNLCWLARFLAGTFLGWPDFWWLIHVCTHTYICMYAQLCTYVCTVCRHEHVTKVTICPHSVDRTFEDKEVHGDSMTADKSMCMCFPWWMCSSMQITPVQ